jgi:hypothetical protein
MYFKNTVNQHWKGHSKKSCSVFLSAVIFKKDFFIGLDSFTFCNLNVIFNFGSVALKGLGHEIVFKYFDKVNYTVVIGLERTYTLYRFLSFQNVL